MDRDKLFETVDNKRALFGLFFSFDNRLQSAGDSFYKEITCKQFFLLICLFVFKKKHPTISELSEFMGSSHQNVKQIVNKLEAKGYVSTYFDKDDRRKLRVRSTQEVIDLGDKYRAKEVDFIERLYENVTAKEIESTFKTLLKIDGNLRKIREESK
ncbi:MAG: MarR family transcriptional regulator [Herbinix sp.]|nr:MarR family transcriptional regulator [Herbinix sp.]